MVNVAIREQRQLETYEEVKSHLKKYHRCMLIRPMGFGKTYITAKLSQGYKNPLYLYPLTVTQQCLSKHKDIIGDKMSYMSFAKLRSVSRKCGLNDEAFKSYFEDYDLFIFDEAHMLGGVETAKCIKRLQRLLGSSVDMVGASGTPRRMDNFDVVSTFFDSRFVSRYTVSDAIKEGIFKKPYYVCASYDVDMVARSVKDRITESSVLTDIDKEELLLKLAEIKLREDNIANMDMVLRDSVIRSYRSVPDYMKFIVFFPDTRFLENKYGSVLTWFKTAFPDKEIKYKIVISAVPAFHKNVHKLDELTVRQNGIDLIFCIDMLNMGYHVEDLTGVVLYRATHSDVLYKQQMSRGFSVMSDEHMIVFDLVNNVLRKPLFINTRDVDTSIPMIENDTSVMGDFVLHERDIFLDDRLVELKMLLKRLDGIVEKQAMDKAIRGYIDGMMPLTLAANRYNVTVHELISELRQIGVDIQQVEVEMGYDTKKKGK